MAIVNVIYHQFPHYRRPIIRELALHGRHTYRFWGSLESDNGILPFGGDADVTIRPLRFKVWRRIWLLGGYWPAVLDRSADALIVLANPNMPASWFIAITARLLRKKVLFWAHGWLKPEPFPKRLLRSIYFKLANHMLVYGQRSKEIGISQGYPADRITTIFNSLDYERARSIRARLDPSASNIERPQQLFTDARRPLLICTARLTELCRFDLLLEAGSKLKTEGMPVNILLVGDGPERDRLAKLAEELDLDVHFYGACYDEEVIARLIYFADITVSPGKIGLTVIHSLSYGTPAITHGDMDQQMPEVEAIERGVTGDFFRIGDASDLAEVIQNWIQAKRDRAELRHACYDIIAKRWNPRQQRVLIEHALNKVLNGETAE
jgi:glycosyltransferase involved in cell wall biosynthesis